MNSTCVQFGYILSIVLLMASKVASINITDFFPDLHGNLTKITWAHAVNNQTYLFDTLQNDKIMMIEADVVLGKLNGMGSDLPIMGHPPVNVSDLSLEGFLQNVTKHNDETNKTKKSKKGVKLDFKSIEVFQESVKIVKKYDEGKFPIWINADIISGPINATTIPVDANQFLDGAKSFPNSTLSIGWTTNYGPNLNGSYEQEQIQQMVEVIEKKNISQEITFPVRAGLAAESIELMEGLIKEVEGSTLTIWSSEGDNVNIDNLRALIGKIGISKTYVDVPSDLLVELRLNDLPVNSSSRQSTNLLSAIFTFMVALLYLAVL